ncbi:MAG: hypothetical protein FJZ01_10610 [Candidatus Sericytochromatia bacterium]|nr:hypothetical protein [Candidatus Tanganyikabacteria bacterium]
MRARTPYGSGRLGGAVPAAAAFFAPKPLSAAVCLGGAVPAAAAYLAPKPL